MQPGLTLVVGPPGTGKTDVAVQIISNLYHNFPNQRTLIVTHSNQALNQLFEKIMALDIDERHLLRLGHGEEALETEKDFSRYGRVNYVLAKRLDLLLEVQRLQVLIYFFLSFLLMWSILLYLKCVSLPSGIFKRERRCCIHMRNGGIFFHVSSIHEMGSLRSQS